MPLRLWLLFCATEAVLCVTPGPAVLMVVSQSLSRGARAGLAASLGILTANTLYFALSATGVGAILAASTRVFAVVKWVGAAYLVYAGVRMIVLAMAERRRGDAGTTAHGSRTEGVETTGRRSFLLGLVTQGANPKALIFFTAILPQFITPASPVLPQIVILGLSSAVIELVVLSIYVATCHSARARAGQSRLALTIQTAGGVLLIAAGALLTTDY